MIDIMPIPTRYHEVDFRSKLEARWAVFFDTLKIRWFYEYEGLDLDGKWRRPDFYLPHLDLWIEIKPGDPKEIPRTEPVLVYLQYHPEKKINFVLLKGYQPYYDPHTCEFDYQGYTHLDDRYYWTECPDCGLIGIEFQGRSDRLTCKDIRGGNCPRSKHGDKGYNWESPKLLSAYLMASQYRFEMDYRIRDEFSRSAGFTRS